MTGWKLLEVRRSALRSAGFRIEARPQAEVYPCRRIERPPTVEPPPQSCG